MENIFVKREEVKGSSPISYTDIIDTIPKNKVTEPIKGWEETYSKEWRWRILKLEDRKIAEISVLKKDSPRIYFIPLTNEWAEREVPDIYDQFVIETYYSYE